MNTDNSNLNLSTSNYNPIQPPNTFTSFIGKIVEKITNYIKLSLGDEKTKAQSSIILASFEGKLEKLSGKNIQEMSTKEFGKHLDKCHKVAEKINNLAVKNKSSNDEIGINSLLNKYRAHIDDVVVKGSNIQSVGMNIYEKSSGLESTIEKIDNNLKISRLEKPQNIKLSNEELDEIIASFGNLKNLTKEDLEKFETQISNNNILKQLNTYLRSDKFKDSKDDATNTIKSFTYFGTRVPNWKEDLQKLHQKLEKPSQAKGRLTADEAWILDHIADPQKIFSAVTKSNIPENPIISTIASPLFSEESIQKITNHRNQKFEVGDIILFGGAKYHGYYGEESDNELQKTFTGSDATHAEIIYAKKNDTTVENMGMWMDGLKKETTDIGLNYYSEGYRVNLRELITPDVEKTLRADGYSESDIDGVLKKIYSEAFTKISMEKTNEELVNPLSRQWFSVFPRIFKKNLTIAELVKSKQTQAMCSEFALITTFKALDEFKNNLKVFCEERGAKFSPDDPIIGFDLNFKIDPEKMHTGYLSKLFEIMINDGVMSQVQKPKYAFPLSDIEVDGVKSIVTNEYKQLDENIQGILDGVKNKGRLNLEQRRELNSQINQTLDELQKISAEGNKTLNDYITEYESSELREFKKRIKLTLESDIKILKRSKKLLLR